MACISLNKYYSSVHIHLLISLIKCIELLIYSTYKLLYDFDLKMHLNAKKDFDRKKQIEIVILQEEEIPAIFVGWGFRAIWLVMILDGLYLVSTMAQLW